MSANVAQTATYASERDLQDALDALNETGVHSELAAMDAVGNAFVASLAGPDDIVTLAYVTTSSDGWSTGPWPCDDCGAEGPNADWHPRWPVVVLVPPSAEQIDAILGGA